MARIIVTADQGDEKGASILLDERVHAVHLSNDHSARQLIERLSWAVRDADSRSGPHRPRRSRRGAAPAGALTELGYAADGGSSPA